VILALLAVCPGCAAIGVSDVPSEVDQTLAAFTADGDLEVYVDHTGYVMGTIMPWSAGVLETATGCPRLHVRVTVNGVEANVAAGSGTQISGPDPVFRCSPPGFGVTLAGGLPATIDVRISDETDEWRMVGEVISSPSAMLVETDGLRVGTWAHLRLDPPAGYVELSWYADQNKCAGFSIAAASGSPKCILQATVGKADCSAIATDVGVPCAIQLTSDGVAFFVPDVGVSGPTAGKLGVEGWPDTQVQCQGTAYCKLTRNEPGYGIGPGVLVPAQVLP